jgi:hypothetical protein
MKYIVFTSALLLLAVSLKAQIFDSNSHKLIESFVKSNIDIQMEPVDPAIVARVFTGKFVKINVGFVESGAGSSSCGDENYINLNETNVKMIEAIHTDVECPILMSLIKKDFLLKDENAAKLFEASLNVLYPVSKNEVQNVRHLKKGSQWIFLRGKFFDDYTAFVVTTGPDGRISGILAKLAFPMN